MRSLSQKFLALSTVTIPRGLKSIAVALCFGTTICLTGIDNAETETVSWTGTIIGVEVDSGAGIYTGTQVGDRFSGTITYDPDEANITAVHTSDGDSVVEPGDEYVEYVTGSGSGTITDGVTEVIGTGATISVTTDYVISDSEEQDFFSDLFGKEVASGSVFDSQGPSSGVGGFSFGLEYLSLLDIQDDLSFRPTPPWSPPGSPDDPDNQVTTFFVEEYNDQGEIYSAIGVVDPTVYLDLVSLGNFNGNNKTDLGVLLRDPDTSRKKLYVMALAPRLLACPIWSLRCSRKSG